ncbi:MAG TPA: glycosyltransferase [Bryobacteraceae bacterium]|nr:glycosyltransferase [Bryobacteraceae bacterium]
MSFKECWRQNGEWFSDGGFPLQIASIGSLFQRVKLMIVETAVRAGGIPLPAGTEVIPIPRPQATGFGRKLWVAAHAVSYIRQFVPRMLAADVVHVPLPGDLPLLGLLTATALRRRVIARYGGSWRTNSQTTYMNRVTRSLMSALAGGRHVMLVAGDEEGRPAAHLHWLFSTALRNDELRRIPAVTRASLQYPPRACYIGRLSPEKGVAILIRAIAGLERRGLQPVPDVTIIGDGPERRRLEQLAASLDCASRFTFVGQVDRTELTEHLVRQDFCIHPSSTESICKAWVDAMAHGLPIVCADVGSAPRAISTNGCRGWLVRPDDEDALADGIHGAIVHTTDWPSLRRRCRTYAEEHTLDRWTEQIGQICAAQWHWKYSEGKLVA